jgi:hypothetical protein
MDPCENGNGFSGCIKGKEYLDQVNDYQLLKKDFCSIKLDRRSLYHAVILFGRNFM